MIDNIYIIVAMTEKSGAIGRNNDLLFHLKEDLKYFKQTTLNNTIVCGRKTYFTFPIRPLPNRKNIVLTRGDAEFEGAIVMHSVDEVVEHAIKNPDEKIFISGGDNVYAQFMDIASKLYVTLIEESVKVEADSYFPKIDMNEWRISSESKCIHPDNAPSFKFVIYDRM